MQIGAENTDKYLPIFSLVSYRDYPFLSAAKKEFF